ncbi:unnamed protein product [Heterobilharzia americana]|nr:unnamed protein product [Heterobilharzia americana]
MTSKMHNDVMNGLNQTGSTNITSLIVRERLKHCVLNKRKSKEQGIGIVGSTSSMTGMIQPVNTKDNPSDKDVCQDSKTITSELVKLNQVKNESDDYIITDKCIDYNQNVMSDCIITPLIGDIENVPSGSHKSLSNQITSSLSSLNTNNSNNNNKVNIFNQTQPYHFSQESDPNYVNFQSLQTSIIGANVCSNLIIQHNSLHNHHHHHPHHHQQQQQHKVTGENLRKTVSEPSLKMRSGSGGVQKSRYKPDRRYFSANSATAAVAAATIAVSNDPLSVVSLWPQLTSAFQHANLVQKTIGKKSILPPPLTPSTTTTTTQQQQEISGNSVPSVDTDEHLSKCETQPLISPLSKTLQDVILTEFMKNNPLTTCYTDSQIIDTINPLGESNISQCIFNSITNGFCSSLPNLTGQSQRSLQRNNHSNMNNTITMNQSTNKSTPINHNVTESTYDLTELSQQDTTMSDVNHSTDNHDELHEDLNKNNHIFPYRRHQSIGLLSRTRSAPLSLATGYTTNRHYQLHNLTGVHNSVNPATSVTSAANILAMEAAASNFTNQSQNYSINSNQLTIDNNLSEKNKNVQSTIDTELSSRSKVVLQLRKKILERSEFLTSDRSGVNSLDSNACLSRPLNQSNGRGNPLLERTASSPVVNMAPTLRPETVPEATFTTVLAYDLGMLAHHCTCQTDANHPENPQRLISIWQRLQQTGLAAQCHHQPGRRASLIELQLVHRDVYTVLFGSNPASRCRIDPTLLATVRLCRLPCGGVGVDSDTAWHTAGHTAHAARLAAGCVVDLACRVILGQCPNGFALVRPPGHHAEPGQAMGFCYFNSVAIATKRAQFLGSAKLGGEQCSVIPSLTSTFFDQSAFLPYTMEPTLKPRILILDWDIHHGNGTQTVFYTDPTVLYISLHRHDEGGFFPGTDHLKK